MRWRGMRRPSPTVIAAIVLGLVVLLLLVTALSRRGDSNQDKLGQSDVAAAEGKSPSTKCGSQKTYELIKREIFRQAADTRGSDATAFDRIAAGASVRVERPLLRAREEEADRLRCSGTLSIDLPPGLSVVGGRRTLNSAIEYVVQPAADGSGDVVMIQGADAIIVPLATLASVRSPALPAPSLPAGAPPDPGAVATEPGLPAQPQTVPPVAASPGTARPSFNCRYARTRGEIAVCRDQGLASLDRQMAAQYERASAAAGARQQAVLQATRNAFLRYRDRCSNDACIAAAYRDRMREIEDIRTDRWRPGQ